MDDFDSYVNGYFYLDSDFEGMLAFLASTGVATSPFKLNSIKLDDYPLKFIIFYYGDILLEERFEVDIDGCGVHRDTVVHSIEKITGLFRANNIGYKITHYDPAGKAIKKYLF